MAKRSTRNKIRFQSIEALSDLKRAEIHLTQLAALADDTSPYINDNLPVIMLALSSVISALGSFDEGL